MQRGRLAVRAGVLGGVAVPARRAAAGVGGRARRAPARARARLPRHAAHARAGARAGRARPRARAQPAHAPQVLQPTTIFQFSVSTIKIYSEDAFKFR